MLGLGWTQATKHTTVKWSLAVVPWVSPKSLKILLVLIYPKLHSKPYDGLSSESINTEQVPNWGNLLVYQAKIEQLPSLPAPVSVWIVFVCVCVWILSSFIFRFYSSSLFQGTVLTTLKQGSKPPGQILLTTCLRQLIALTFHPSCWCSIF